MGNGDRGMSALPKSPHGRHVGFATAELTPKIAHGGKLPVLSERALSGADCAACRFVDLVELPAGADIGVHTHDGRGEELYVVISGAGRMHLDGATFSVAAGDVIVNRPNGTHGLVNVGAEPLRLVVVEVAVDASIDSARP